MSAEPPERLRHHRCRGSPSRTRTAAPDDLKELRELIAQAELAFEERMKEDGLRASTSDTSGSRRTPPA
jgi:hypothetical protein